MILESFWCLWLFSVVSYRWSDFGLHVPALVLYHCWNALLLQSIKILVYCLPGIKSDAVSCLVLFDMVINYPIFKPMQRSSVFYIDVLSNAWLAVSSKLPKVLEGCCHDW